MNELSVIGSLRLRKNFWIATGQTLQAAVRRPKKPILERDQCFFAVVYYKCIKTKLIRGKCKFWLVLPRNMS